MLGVERGQHLGGDAIRQRLDKVSQVVDIHAFGGVDQVVQRHVAYQAVAQFFAEVDEHFAFFFRVDQIPQELALGRRYRFEQMGNFSRRELIQHGAGMLHGAGLQRLVQRLELAFGFF